MKCGEIRVTAVDVANKIKAVMMTKEKSTVRNKKTG